MDLRHTPEQAQLLIEVHTWLAENVPATPLPPADTREGFEAHRAWERRLFDGGLAAVDWPTEFGGRGLDPQDAALFTAEYARSGAPARLNRIGLGLVGPALFEHGTPQQQERWLAATLASDIVWCQGFSEPDAGSDLAALNTRGVVETEVVRVTGQKIWTSYARFADWIIALVRTEPGSVGHRGISCVAIDLTTPGIEVRPIQQLNGQEDFCEVFFDDVRVPLDNVIGPLGDGWKVATSVLAHERGGSTATATHLRVVLDEVISTMTAEQREDPFLLAEIGRIYEHLEAHRGIQERSLTEGKLGRPVGRQALINKLWWSQTQVAVHALGLKILGEEAQLADGEGESFRARAWLARASLIYAGTNEIQRSIIAERGLGLPREARRAV